MSDEPRGKYFEQLNIGDEFYTPSKTVTEADIVNFASLSGDWNPLHTDEEFAKKTQFGERIAHGLLSLAIASGLLDKIGLIDGTTIAFLGLDWRFRGAVKIGDTITVKIVVGEKRETKKAGRGIVKFNVSIFNQKGELVSAGAWDMMMASRQ